MASNGDHYTIRRAAVQTQIRRSFLTAKVGVLQQTTGTTKIAAARRLHEQVKLGGVGTDDRGLVSNLRVTSRIGVNHKEGLAIVAADMRGSTALANANAPDDMFVLIQCFLPLLAFIVREMGGEVVGLRGDGLIAAFGFNETAWRPCVNLAYEAGMMMIEAARDELNPYLRKEGIPTPSGIGIGVDCGEVTITKIGLGDAVEVTAYGMSVNQAAKKSKLMNQLWLSFQANKHLHAKDTEQIFSQSYQRLAG